ncbi:hypothetical protein BDZ89DRAFT_1124589 [Hymenopellis radicata]|nr:hypothetical protein BDZ89DRAFT_1124589 [Hymenopellis radicata]
MPNSFDGEIARVFPAEDVFVTTPNATYIPNNLLLGRGNVRLRKNCYFGEDDPLLHPQYFNSRVPHLSCIPSPVIDWTLDEYWIFWYTPELPGDFETNSDPSTAQNVGRIRQAFREKLFDAAHKLLRKVRDEVAKPPNEKLAKDRVLSMLRNRLRYFMKRLDLVASFVEAVATFRHTTRIGLELRGRFTWLTSVRQHYYDPTPTQGPAEVLRVIGALTFDLTVAENLHRVTNSSLSRIPFWLIRPLNRKPGVRATVWMDESVPPPPPCWQSPGEWDDTEPPNTTIFNGDARNLDRYRAMHDFIDSQMSSYASFSLPISQPSASTSATPATTLSSSDNSTGVTRIPSDRAQSRSSPYPPPPSRMRKTTQTSAQKQPQRNKFLDVDSPLMPPSIPSWNDAMKRASHLGLTDLRREPWHGAHTGYCLPDPNAIVSATKEETVAGELRVLCKLWDVLLYRLTSDRLVVLKPKEWRAILTIETHTTTTPGTKSADRRKEMQALVNECLRNGMKAIATQKTAARKNDWQLPVIFPRSAQGTAGCGRALAALGCPGKYLASTTSTYSIYVHLVHESLDGALLAGCAFSGVFRRIPTLKLGWIRGALPWRHTPLLYTDSSSYSRLRYESLDGASLPLFGIFHADSHTQEHVISRYFGTHYVWAGGTPGPLATSRSFSVQRKVLLGCSRRARRRGLQAPEIFGNVRLRSSLEGPANSRLNIRSGVGTVAFGTSGFRRLKNLGLVPILCLSFHLDNFPHRKYPALLLHMGSFYLRLQTPDTVNPTFVPFTSASDSETVVLPCLDVSPKHNPILMDSEYLALYLARDSPSAPSSATLMSSQASTIGQRLQRIRRTRWKNVFGCVAIITGSEGATEVETAMIVGCRRSLGDRRRRLLATTTRQAAIRDLNESSASQTRDSLASDSTRDDSRVVASLLSTGHEDGVGVMEGECGGGEGGGGGGGGGGGDGGRRRRRQHVNVSSSSSLSPPSSSPAPSILHLSILALPSSRLLSGSSGSSSLSWLGRRPLLLAQSPQWQARHRAKARDTPQRLPDNRQSSGGDNRRSPGGRGGGQNRERPPDQTLTRPSDLGPERRICKDNRECLVLETL